METVTVPVESHVLKFLRYYQEEENYFLSEGDIYGLFLLRLLREVPVERRRDAEVAAYEAGWRVHLGSYGSDSWGLKPPTSKAAYLFNSFVHKVMLKELHQHVEDLLEFNVQAKHAIQGFMAKFDLLEEDIQFDTLQKSWQRYWSHRKQTRKRRVSQGGRLPLKELEKRLRQVGGPLAKAA